MALDVTDNGSGNIVDGAEDAEERVHGRLILNGSDSKLTIGPHAMIEGCHIELGSGCEVAIGSHCVSTSMFIYLAGQGSVVIGDGVSFNARVRLMAHEPGRIAIGDLSLFASDVDVTTSDMHSILDADSGLRINPAQDVAIGRRVWVGQRAMILKGTQIGDDSVIAAGAIVSGHIPPGVVAAGIPARVVRTGIRWDRSLL